MRFFLSVKNVTINALLIFYGSNTVQRVSTIGNIRQRPPLAKFVKTCVRRAAKHISSGLGYGGTGKIVKARTTDGRTKSFRADRKKTR